MNNDNNEVIKFRPHHFLCTIGFRGKGYSPNFIRNYKNIKKKLYAENGDEVSIEVVKDTNESICKACPNNIKKTGACIQQPKIEALDKAHMEVLGIKYGESLTWKEAKEKIINNMTLEKFHKACDGCNWKEYGICEDSLRELQNTKT